MNESLLSIIRLNEFVQTAFYLVFSAIGSLLAVNPDIPHAVNKCSPWLLPQTEELQKAVLCVMISD